MGRNILTLVVVFTLSGATGAQTVPQPSAPPTTSPPLGMPPPSLHDNATIPIQSIARIAGENETPVRGIGLVTGLKGTGDQGSEMVLARPLAAWYAANGNVIADLKDLAKGKSAAIVMLSAIVPAGGARMGDKLDVIVSVAHSATNLERGVLMVSPMLGPLPGQGMIGEAGGVIHVPDPAHPTMGVIPGGLQISYDITMKAPGPSIDLVVKPVYRGWRTTQMIASVINDASAPLDDDQRAQPPIARAVDSVTVRIDVPAHERGDPAGFIAGIMTRRLSPALLDTEPTIICDRQSGTIIATGNVEISTVAVASKDLMVTNTVPPPAPTQADPLIKRERWVAVQTSGKPAERTRIEDLLQAFRQLDVPIDTQIEILDRISKSGSLHARLHSSRTR